MIKSNNLQIVLILFISLFNLRCYNKTLSEKTESIIKISNIEIFKEWYIFRTPNYYGVMPPNSEGDIYWVYYANQEFRSAPNVKLSNSLKNEILNRLHIMEEFEIIVIEGKANGTIYLYLDQQNCLIYNKSKIPNNLDYKRLNKNWHYVTFDKPKAFY